MNSAAVQKEYKAEMKRKTAKPMLWLAMVSMVMFFGACTSAMIVKMAEADWTDLDLPSMFTISTVIIVLSSIFLHLGLYSAKKDRMGQVKLFLLVALLLGLTFGVTQFLGWRQMIAQDIYPSGPTSTPNSQFIFAFTFFHLLHIFGGWVSLIVVNVKARKERYNSKNLLGLQLSTTYWHFVDLLWIYLFVFLSIYS